jgi:transcriptional regulator with XRE-family HTH domain
MKKTSISFADKIREAIAAAGLTREQVADRSGLHIQTVYKLLSGARKPNGETLAALCRVLGVSADELLGIDKSQSK